MNFSGFRCLLSVYGAFKAALVAQEPRGLFSFFLAVETALFQSLDRQERAAVVEQFVGEPGNVLGGRKLLDGARSRERDSRSSPGGSTTASSFEDPWMM